MWPIIRNSLFTLVTLLVIAGCAGRVTDPRVAYEKGDYETTLETGLTYLDEHPGDDELRRIVGEAAFAVGDTFLAVEVFRPLLREDTTQTFRNRMMHAAVASGHLLLARELITSRLSESADAGDLRDMLSRIDRRMRDAKSHAAGGDSLLARDEWARAAGAYQRALKAFAANDEYRGKLLLAQAEILAGHSDPEKRDMALVRVVDAREVWKNAALTWWIEGDVLMKLERYDQGVKAMQKALEMGIGEPFATRARQFVRSSAS
jgi:tetratricopeptide (TPR) repeat protein